MQFKNGALAALTVFVVSAATSAVPVVQGDCSAADHPCKTYSNYATCSPEWSALLDKCIPTGCIKWVRDPKADCPPCGADNHPCKTYSNYEKCSPEWNLLLDRCIASQCIKWVRDPKADCPTCESKDHPCNLYQQYPQCSEPWVTELKKCVPSGCINWVQDPLAVCDYKSSDSKKSKRATYTYDCSATNHPCNKYVQYPQCSPEWLALIKKCSDSGCMQWFQDPTAVCRKESSLIGEA